VLLASSYSGALRIPAELARDLPASAAHSIGETMIAAERLGSAGQPLVEAARSAFSDAHGMVLLSAASLIGLLAIAVFIALRHYKDHEVTAGAH
jgi:DHA2 family multidrug resistance protein-like MFS transporter